VSRQVTRLEETLNNPRVVLVVGAVAVALNVLLYFGVFLPRMTPLFGHVYAIGTSIPEAIAKLGPEASGKADSEAISKKSVPEASGKLRLGASGKSVTEGSLGSVSDSPQDPPSGTPPNSPQDTPSGTPPVSRPPQASASPQASVPPQSSAPPQFPSGSPPQSSSPSTQQYR
jgi:hypothetical protein